MTSDERFSRLVRFARSGGRLPRATIDQILAQCGKTDRDLTEQLLVGSSAGAPEPGDPCNCGGRLYVANSKPRGNFRVQYLKCAGCRRNVGKRIIPSGSVRTRIRN